MATPATNLQASISGNQVLFTWDLPIDIAQVNTIWLDIATESGFVNYVLQHELIPKTLTSFIATLQTGYYWIRINAHYPGFGTPEFGPLDRGWFPSQHIFIVIGNPAPLPSGTPATNLRWTAPNHLTWTPGKSTAETTRVAVDISTFPNFNDILAAPFINTPACTVTVEGFPFAIDVGLPCNSEIGIYINGLPAGQEFYLRVNTLYNNLVWVPSSTLHFKTDGSIEGMGGLSWWLLAGALGTIGLIMYINSKEEESA
jgi:hypothetical protein